MLREVPAAFPSSAIAKRCLTLFRKRYRVALRGAVCGSVTAPDGERAIGRLWVPLDGTGFSPAEFASAIGAILSEVQK